MPFHHVAITTRDLAATHAFYTGAMGFTLLRVEVGETPESVLDPGGSAPDAAPRGWARHVFYDCGGGECLAVWELHDPAHLPDEFDPSISRGLGLPSWTNHLAFVAPTAVALAEHRDRWLTHGLAVVEVDHGWCRSIYVDDPNGITVEFCCTTGPVADPDAMAHLADPAPTLGPPPPVALHLPDPGAASAGVA